jgi:hypothetical protein
MDRRSFLKVLGTVGVLTGAPGWLTDLSVARLFGLEELPPDDDLSPFLAPRDLAVYGRGLTHDLFASNNSENVATVALTRPLSGWRPDVLLQFQVAPGGIVRWNAAPGQEIHGPVRIVMPEGIQGYVTGTDMTGRLVIASRDWGVIPADPDAVPVG